MTSHPAQQAADCLRAVAAAVGMALAEVPGGCFDLQQQAGMTPGGGSLGSWPSTALPAQTAQLCFERSSGICVCACVCVCQMVVIL
jgi:hypothetical protein